MTVEDGLREVARQYNVTFEGYLEVWLEAHIHSSLPSRYRHLAREVVFRLPEGWDEHADWTVSIGLDNFPGGYASTLREEEGSSETLMQYLVELYPSMMDRLSDKACRWVIAHEFAHVASNIPSGSISIGGKPFTRIIGTEDQYEEAPPKGKHEDGADNIALGWGFDIELQAFLYEDTE